MAITIGLTLWYIFLFLLVLAFFGLLVWLAIVVFGVVKERKDTTLLLNFNATRDGGNFIGEIVNIDHNTKKGRPIIEYEVKDIDISNPELILQKAIIDNGKMLSMPKGTLSKKRNVIIALPPRAEDLTGSFKETLFGKGIMFMTELDNFAKTQVEILREANNRKDSLAKEIGTGELSVIFTNQIKEHVQDYLDGFIAKKNDGKPAVVPYGQVNREP